MGALYPIAGGIKEIGTALGTVNQAVSAAQFITGVNNPNDVALEQLQQRQRLQEKQIAQQNALEREGLDNLRRASLDLDLSQTRSLNLLQATQLAERNNINRLF